LHRDPVEPRLRSFALEISPDSAERLAHLRFVFEIQLDAGHLALVAHLWREHLEHDRKSDLRRRVARSIRTRRHLRHCDRQAERVQNALALDFA